MCIIFCQVFFNFIYKILFIVIISTYGKFFYINYYMNMTRFKRLLVLAIFFLPALTWADSDITLLFGGDIMAHNSNYTVKDLNDIWKGVKLIIQDSDLAFANIEAPVDATRPVSSFPQFNMSVEYIQAAIDAGFSVFSLTNNH